MRLSGSPRDKTSAPRHDARSVAADPALQQEPDSSGFTSIGLSPAAGWYSSAALYWIGGLSVILIDQFSGGAVRPVIGVLGTLALASVPLLLLGAHYAPDAWWGVPLRILFPLLILFIGGFYVGAAISALVLLLLFPLLAVAYMHRPIIAVPYCTVSLVVMAGLLIHQDSSGPAVARAITLTGVMAALVAGLVYSQHRLRMAAAANHERSVTDPLTGLANLRGLRLRLQQELKRTAREHSEVVMYAIDLDDFKDVNENFSYALGDAVLQAVAQALNEEAEPGDLVARRGGDEFAVLALAVPGRHMARYGDRIAAAIERARRAICPAVNPRASVSRVTHQPGETPEAYMRRIDEGLHAAKIDAHPERAGSDLAPAIGHPEVGLEEHRARMLEGARRIRLAGRSGTSTRGTRMEWRISGNTALVIAALMAIVTASGLLAGVSLPIVAVCVAALLAAAAFCYSAGSRQSERKLMYAPLALMLAATIVGVAASGPDRWAMAELCVLPIPLAVTLFGGREAAAYAVAGSCGYAWFMIGSGEPYALLQVLAMLGIMSVLILMLRRGQQLAGEFSATAEAISVVDPLTGTGNLRGFHQRVEEEIARSDTTGSRPCITMIDLERFKSVNDRYSHTMGDALLIETARAIESVVREDELVVRRGGDEFAVVSSTSGEAEISALAQRIREAILAARIRLTPDLIAGATVVSVVHHHGESADDLLTRADDALQRAKSGERIPTKH